MRGLRATEIRELVPMRQAIEMMKTVFAASSRGEVISPLRTPVDMPDGSGVVLFMPAFVPASSDAPAATGAKIVSVFGGNRALGLPTINAIVIVVDPATGVPLGFLEGASVTALRTGAVSGAATDLLARPDARTLAVIGAGAQGVTQAVAVAAVRDVADIWVVDRFEETLESFRERLSVWAPELVDRVRTTTDAREAVAQADVICTATTATSPVFEDDWLRPGTHINAVGAYTPTMQEIPDATIARAYLVVDEVEAALHEAGDLIQAIERGAIQRSDVVTELGQVVSGSARRRQSDDEITFFKTVGNAIQDMIVAGAALQAAEKAGIGQQLDLN
jgi:alanine dehydrogenase